MCVDGTVLVSVNSSSVSLSPRPLPEPPLSPSDALRPSVSICPSQSLPVSLPRRSDFLMPLTLVLCWEPLGARFLPSKGQSCNGLRRPYATRSPLFPTSCPTTSPIIPAAWLWAAAQTCQAHAALSLTFLLLEDPPGFCTAHPLPPSLCPGATVSLSPCSGGWRVHLVWPLATRPTGEPLPAVV